LGNLVIAESRIGLKIRHFIWQLNATWRLNMRTPRNKRVLLFSAVLIVAGCTNSDDDDNPSNPGDDPGLPTLSKPVSTVYDGSGDGLLAGLGLSGLLQADPMFFNDPAAPTTEELRRQAIYANYAALIDRVTPGGFGSVYGPIDDTTYSGSEHIAYIGDGINRATLMVQIPDTFDPEQPCVVAAPSSGSRGVYGAVGTGGAWGLERGCAVAYTDANKGTGAVDLTQNKGFGLQLDLIDLASSEQEATFIVPTQENVTSSLGEYGGVSLPTQQEVDDYIARNPNRFAFKHAHSQKNIEKDWGLHTIQSVQFALKTLNEQYERSFTADNTLIIGASVSNGGSALLRAVEQNPTLFDGVVVGEPNISPQAAPERFSIVMGAREAVTDHSKSAYDFILQAELYAACASKAPQNTGALLAENRGDTTARCEALAKAGLLTSTTAAEQSVEAAEKLNAAGFLSESNKILVGYAGIDLFQSLLATYANAYTRSSVIDTLCNVSMAHVIAGEFAPAAKPDLDTLAAVSNGIPRTQDVYLIKDDAEGGPTLQIVAKSSNGTADYNMEGALCWKALLDDTANPLNARLLSGIEEIKASGDLSGTPTIMVHGRADALIPVNHSSRPYFALNQQREGDRSQLFYYEIKHAQHLDVFNSSYAMASMNFVPIDYYFKQALDLMYRHLSDDEPLPPSQVVQTTPPSGALTAENLTAILADAADLIVYENGLLTIPE